MDNKLQTIILRFRDLNINNTIESHKEIINQFTYVWWGWWAKPQEKVPIEEFVYLGKLSLFEQGLRIFLFDSGKEKIYEATCKKIEFHNGQPMQTPEEEKTPEYYRDQKYKLWFKLSKISEVVQDVEKLLHQYSYLCVDDFFVSGRSLFSVFYNKQVFSLSELAEQQRTIWFLKKKEKGDKVYEIHSYNNEVLMNQNNPTNFPVLKSNEILWLSDLHFSEKHHGFVEKAGDKNRLSNRLNKELEKIEAQPSFVIISGDLTYTADENEFKCVGEFLKDFNSMCGLNQYLYAIVPGNHDISFSNKEFDAKKQVEVAFDKAKEAYVDFYREYFGVEPEEKLFSIHRILSNNLQPIEIICINSCLLQQEKDHFQGMGFVGNDQMNEVEEYLKSTKNSKAFRILVMHHHLLPVAFKEEPKFDGRYSIMLDSEAINQFILRNKIKLVLHGHTHKEYYAEIIRPAPDDTKYKYYVVGLGSSGVVEEDLSESRQNMFAILSFLKDRIVIKGYSIHSDGQDSQEIFSYDILFEEEI